jgi:hypothetical protein
MAITSRTQGLRQVLLIETSRGEQTMTRIVISATLAVILGIGAFFPVALAGPGDGPCCVIEHTTTLAETD